MDVQSGYPFWPIKNGLMHAFPKLQAAVQCDVAVLGAGITGALIADELAKHGFDVAVIEERDVGWGSTSATTALLRALIERRSHPLAARFSLKRFEGHRSAKA